MDRQKLAAVLKNRNVKEKSTWIRLSVLWGKYANAPNKSSQKAERPISRHIPFQNYITKKTELGYTNFPHNKGSLYPERILLSMLVS